MGNRPVTSWWIGTQWTHVQRRERSRPETLLFSKPCLQVWLLTGFWRFAFWEGSQSSLITIVPRTELFMQIIGWFWTSLCVCVSFKSLFIFISYFWRCWVFVAALRHSLVEQASHCGGFSCCGARALCTRASVAVMCGLSCFTACETFLDQGSNLRPLQWQVDS